MKERKEPSILALFDQKANQLIFIMRIAAGTLRAEALGTAWLT